MERNQLLATVLAAPLLLITPFVGFVVYHDYGWFHPEIGLCLALLSGAGLALGGLMAVGGRFVRALLVAGLVVLFVDVQTEAGSFGWVHGAVFAAVAFVAWRLGPRLGSVVAPAVGAMLVLTLLLPGGAVVEDRTYPERPAVRARELPVILHLVLDEHVAIRAMPRRHDRDKLGGRVARETRKLYRDSGFRVFESAYSLYDLTVLSIGNLLNFDASGVPLKYAGLGLPWRLYENAYFEEMTRRGYRIHVYQPEFMEYCETEGEIDLGHCHTFFNTGLKPLRDLAVPARDRASYIAGRYSTRSHLLTQLRLALPEDWIASTANLSAVSTLPVFERLADDLARARPGSLYYAHMMVPHSPYAYTSECEVRPLRDWLTNSAGRGMRMSNSRKTIAARIPLYLSQIECTNRQVARLFERMKDAGVFENAIILVHGDHGSRIAKYDGGVGRTELLARYSTLFALRAPGQRAVSERAVVPIHDLFETFVREGTLPRRIATPGKRKIFVEDGHSSETGVIATRSMPTF